HLVSTLTAGTTTVSVGDRVTLSCSVEKSAGWKYEWFRRTSHTSEYRINDGENGNIRVSQGGIYRCRGSRGEPTVYSDKSDEVTISITLSVTQKPSWSQMFRGETITLTCEVQGGEGVQWEYEWRTPQSQTFRTNRKDWTFTASISGDYSCKSRPTDDSYSGTKSRLTAGTITVLVGDRVTLSCSVEKSAGWKYEWFRRTSHTSEYRINDGENGNIRVSQGGIYRCRGSRGEPAVYSDISDEVTINITLSVTQKPSWSQMFRGETITLTCEVQGGEGVQWEYEWRTPQSQTFRTNRTDWTFTASISGDYSCKSRPTDDSYSGTKWSKGTKLTFSGELYFLPVFLNEAKLKALLELQAKLSPLLQLVEDFRQEKARNDQQDNRQDLLERRMHDMDQQARMNNVILTGLQLQPRAQPGATNVSMEANRAVMDATSTVENQVGEFLASKAGVFKSRPRGPVSYMFSNQPSIGAPYWLNIPDPGN
uniref:Ig-like domain-containing protein n=1 Tax=Oryzias melastigma TaxID=30732 RepID=A0A3B3BW55_ORYME